MDIGLIIDSPSSSQQVVKTLHSLRCLVSIYSLSLCSRYFFEDKSHNLLIIVTQEQTNLLPAISEIKTKINTPLMILEPASSTQLKQAYLETGAEYYFDNPSQLPQAYEIISQLKNRPSQNFRQEKLIYKDLCLDPNSRMLYRGKTSYQLPNKEYLLLELLIKNPNRIFSKQDLFEQIWDFNAEIRSTTVETHVCSLRKKIDSKFYEKRLHTIPYSGYILK